MKGTVRVIACVHWVATTTLIKNVAVGEAFGLGAIVTAVHRAIHAEGIFFPAMRTSDLGREMRLPGMGGK